MTTIKRSGSGAALVSGGKGAAMAVKFVKVKIGPRAVNVGGYAAKPGETVECSTIDATTLVAMGRAELLASPKERYSKTKKED